MGKGSSGKARRGGAGIPSTPGISENERAAAGMERIEQERYDQVKKMFENELGFKNAANLAYAVRKGEVNMALIGAQARKLKQLERVYGAIGQSTEGGWGDMKQMAADAFGGTVAQVAHRRSDPSSQSLSINKKYYKRVGDMISTVREGERDGWWVKTDGSVRSRATHSITHEYGHMLANVMTSKHNKKLRSEFKQPISAAQFASQAKRSITSIAVKKYGAKKGDIVSRYGSSNSAEFFAEAFASAHGGSPNAFGKAMQDWLKKQGF